MATRFNASGKNLVRTTNVPLASAFTAMLWVRLANDRNAYSIFIALENGLTQTGLLGTYSDGTTFDLYSGSTDHLGSVLQVGRWYHVCLTSDGATQRGYLNGVLDVSGSTFGYTPTGLYIGNDLADEWLDGAVRHIKVWDDVLTPGEIMREMRSKAPLRRAKLNTWCPSLPGARGIDYSGNGYNFTETGTLADEADPPEMLFARPALPLFFADAPAGGPITHVTGLSLETDSAFAIARVKTRSVGLASEADSALAVTRAKVRSVGIALETDSAFGVTRSKVRAVGLATEADSAFSVGRLKTRAAGLATEADTAFPLGSSITHTVGLADEADSAFSVGRLKQRAVGLCEESDTAFSIARAKLRVLGLAGESDSAFIVLPARTRSVGLAAELDTAFAIARLKARAIGMALETDTAFEFVAGVPSLPGLEYTLLANRLHYTVPDQRMHYTLPLNRLHYTLPEED